MKMVKKICSLLLLLSLFICPICYGKNVFESVPIGKVEIEENILLDGENCYPLLKVKNQYYVPLSSLEKMGATLTEENQTLYIIGPLERNKWSDFSVELFEDQIAYMRAYPVYYNNIRSFSLMVQNEILVPLQLLEAMWDIKEYSDTFIIQDKLQNPLYLVEINEKGIHNKTDHLLPVHYSHIYWNGKSYEVTKEYTLLEESEAKEWLLDEEKLYITTVVTQISGLDLEIDETLYGQYYEPIFRQYSQALRLNALDHQFPIFKIQGQVKYNVGPFKEKDFVEICRSEKNNYFVVKDDSGKKYQVPYNSIRVIGEKGAILNKVTNQDIEDFATLSEIESATDYLLWTDIYRQRTYVLKKQENTWHLEQSFVCSTGKNHNPTPGGFYEVQYMIPYIGIEKGYRCKYALVFFRDYMYHSILFDQSGKYIKSGQYELGSKASHGCVRLSEKDSAWLYQNIPVKTKVWIR